MPTVSGTNKYSRYRLSSHKGEYIKGETAPNRSEANRGAIPLYACFSLELSFSGKKKAEKEQLKYLSIYLDRGSVISSPLTQTKQITTSPFHIL